MLSPCRWDLHEFVWAGCSPGQSLTKNEASPGQHWPDAWDSLPDAPPLGDAIPKGWAHMYIGLGTLIFVLVVVAIIYLIRRA